VVPLPAGVQPVAAARGGGCDGAIRYSQYGKVVLEIA